MAPSTQGEIFQRIQEKAKRKREEGTTFTSGVITKLPNDLYAANLQGALSFDSQDDNGFPVRKCVPA